MKHKITLLARMYDGGFIPVEVNGIVYHKEVKAGAKGLYIRIGNKAYYEKDLPVGVEVLKNDI